MREKYGEQSEDEREVSYHPKFMGKLAHIHVLHSQEAMKLLGSRKLKHESPHEETEVCYSTSTNASAEVKKLCAVPQCPVPQCAVPRCDVSFL